MGASAGALCATEDAEMECAAPCPTSLASGASALGEQECANIGLVLATVRDDLAGVERALTMGANPDTTMDLRLKLGDAAPKGCRDSSMTPLMRACELGYEGVVSTLLDASACADYTDPDGWTPLCYALGNGEIACAKLLVARMDRATKMAHIDLVHDLQEELLEICGANAGPEAVVALQKEFAVSGFFAKHEHCEGSLAPDVSVPRAACKDRGAGPHGHMPEALTRAAKSLAIAPAEAVLAPDPKQGPVRELALAPAEVVSVDLAPNSSSTDSAEAFEFMPWPAREVSVAPAKAPARRGQSLSPDSAEAIV